MSCLAGSLLHTLSVSNYLLMWEHPTPMFWRSQRRATKITALNLESARAVGAIIGMSVTIYGFDAVVWSKHQVLCAQLPSIPDKGWVSSFICCWYLDLVPRKKLTILYSRIMHLCVLALVCMASNQQTTTSDLQCLCDNILLQDDFPYIAGFVPVVLAWVVSPVAAGICVFILYGLLRTFVLRAKRSFDIACVVSCLNSLWDTSVVDCTLKESVDTLHPIHPWHCTPIWVFWNHRYCRSWLAWPSSLW